MVTLDYQRVCTQTRAVAKKTTRRKSTKLAVTRVRPALGTSGGKATAIKKTKHTALVERLFGTDGVRDVAGRGALTPERILALGRALGRFLADQTGKDSRPMVLLGVDPRPSADLVGTALAAGTSALATRVR